MCCSLFFSFFNNWKKTIVQCFSFSLCVSDTRKCFSFLPAFLTHVCMYIYRYLQCIKVLVSDIKKKDIEASRLLSCGHKMLDMRDILYIVKKIWPAFLFIGPLFFCVCEPFRLCLLSRKRRSCHCTNFLIGSDFKSWIEFHGNQFDVEYRCLD
jgi:hypothetical protein